MYILYLRFSRNLMPLKKKVLTVFWDHFSSQEALCIFHAKKCIQFCHQRFTNFISWFFLFFCYFFPKNKRLFSTWESFSKTAILHACKSITLCKQAQKFGRLSSENLSSYLKTFFKRNGCLRYKRNSIF